MSGSLEVTLRSARTNEKALEPLEFLDEKVCEISSPTERFPHIGSFIGRKCSSCMLLGGRRDKTWHMITPHR